MRLFYDTEFLEDGKTIELISIGMVAEDGRELYLVNRDAPWWRIIKHAWLMENVVPHLPQPHGDWILQMPSSWPIDFYHPRVKPRAVLADAVHGFLAGTPDVELWADYGAYDHVALCQLWGPMSELPDGIPMWTNDFRQLVSRSADQRLPPQPADAHDALADARWLRDAHAALTGSAA